MPYTVKGKNIYKHGKLIATASSPANAKASVRARMAAEHGWKPTKNRKAK